MTPVGLDARDRLNATYLALESEKIIPWQMKFKTPDGVSVDDGHGRKISRGGSEEFAGQPQDIFWEFLDPVLADTIAETFNNAYFEGKSFVEQIALAALQETADLLKEFVNRVYQRMAEVDRVLRGNGYPQNVPVRDIAPYLDRWKGEIELRHKAFLDAVDAARPKGIAKFSAWFSKKKLDFIPGAVVAGAISLAVSLVVSFLTRQ